MPNADAFDPVMAVLRSAWGIEPATRHGDRLTSGFSGARLVMITGADGRRFVLKEWPAGTDRHRIAWVHALAQHLHDAGIDAIHPAVPTRSGDTVAADSTGASWELLPFVSGCCRASPTPSQAASAGQMLAHIHLAAASLPGSLPGLDVPAAVIRRTAGAARLVKHPWRLPSSTTRPEWVCGDILNAMAGAIASFAALGGEQAMRRVVASSRKAVPVQPVLRDIWYEHLLFESASSPQVSGVIDLHAAGIDTPATDLARLLGSWHEDSADTMPARWRDAIAAYESIRPLVEHERGLIPWLHASGVVLALDNWFRWIFDEERVFSSPNEVIARVHRLHTALPSCLRILSNPSEWLV